MNYYKTSVLDKLDMTPQDTVIPVLMNYLQQPSQAHDSLERCQMCRVKYDMHDLFKLGFGKFVCKYCLNGAA